MRRLSVALALIALVACTGGQVDVKTGSPDPATTTGWTANWPQFLLNGAHTSHQVSATAITPKDAGDLRIAWSWDAPRVSGRPAPQLFATPVVVDGTIYIGSMSGTFYALDATTGRVRWSQDLGWVPNHTCGQRGITSTAAFADGTVFVGGGDGNLYAMNADDGAIEWKTRIVTPSAKVNDAYLWGSPLVADGIVYIGMSSQCDHPLIRGGIKAVDADTGKVVSTFFIVPPDAIGGSVWSSLAADAHGTIYASTGNPEVTSPRGRWGVSFGLVSFTPPLKLRGSWEVPQDDVRVKDYDFGASPTIWRAGGATMYGACNKDGTFYAVNARTNRPTWQASISKPYPSSSCLSAAVADEKLGRLFIASGASRGATGVVVALDPATGDDIWRHPLPSPDIGSLTENGAGVLAVPVFGPESVILLSAKDGRVLGRVNANEEQVFAQPVWSDRYLFVATVQGHLFAYTT